MRLRASGVEADGHALQAEPVYAAALKCERQGDESCVDLYFRAAVLTRGDRDLDRIHKPALTRLVASGQQFGRLDARSHLKLIWNGQRQSIPVTHHGFVWNPADFEHLTPVGDYSTNAFRMAHRAPGCGIPLVVSGPGGRPYLPVQPLFAATLVLRSGNLPLDGRNPDLEAGPWALELYDPLRVDTVLLGDRPQPLAKDLSAPLAYRLRDQRSTILNDFFMPQLPEVESRFYALEPYQPGKVPVVLIHGLLSDPFTWVEAVNELSASEGFVDNFQIWLFEYPSAQPFLFSAASLREQMAAAQQTFDPGRSDQRFSEMVLVGHSMGGLISKLQATSSGDTLWRSIAYRPIEHTVLQPSTRKRLTEAFFFEPSPQVSRIVFIGTPHQGSVQARRLISRVISSLVTQSPETVANHRELIDSNPGVFSSEFTRRVPTSIDLLEPDSGLLQGLYALRLREDVEAHSIIGDGRWTLSSGRSDGVVPVESARYPQAVSERFVATSHTRLDKHVETIEELRRILAEHLQSLPSPAAN